MSTHGLGLLLEVASSIIEAIAEQQNITFVPNHENRPTPPPSTEQPEINQPDVHTDETVERIDSRIQTPVISKLPAATQKRVVNREQLRQMMIYKEILDPPLSMREERGR